MNPDERPSKRDAFNAFFGEGWVSIHLDARREGVQVPGEHTSNRHLVLQYGQNMPIPIPDLQVDDLGITATLSFSRTPHRTFVPWTAVYIVACNDGRGILYYEDVPEDVSFFARPIDSKTGEPVGPVLDGDSPTSVDVGPADDEGDTEVEQLDGEAEAPPKRKRAVKRERLLKSVPAEPPSNEPETDKEEATATATRRRKRPQLRVVK